MADPRLTAKILSQMAPIAPTPRPDLPEDALNPGQMAGLQYSRDRYNDGTYQVNPGPDPSITSFMGAIGQAPDGSYMNYPTFWDGKVMRTPNGQIDFNGAMQRALQHEQQTGKQFARYPTEDAANAGESMVHKIMEQDAARILAMPQTQQRLRGGR